MERIHKTSEKITALIVLMMIICLFFAGYWWGKMGRYERCVSCYATEALSRRQIQEFYQNQKETLGETMLFWGEKQDCIVYAEEKKQECRVTHLEVYGQPEILFWDCMIPYQEIEDKTGCMIDENTAYSLYGDKHVTGRHLKFGEKIYTVRAVLHTETRLFLTQMGEEETTIIDTFTIHVPNGQTPGAVQTKMQSLFQEFQKPVNLTIWNDMMRVLLAASVCYVVLIYLVKWKGIKFSCKIMGVVFAICFFYLCATVSVDDLPAKWGDLFYWNAFWKEKEDNIIQFIKMPKRNYEMGYLACMGKSLFFVSCFLLLSGLREKTYTKK